MSLFYLIFDNDAGHRNLKWKCIPSVSEALVPGVAVQNRVIPLFFLLGICRLFSLCLGFEVSWDGCLLSAPFKPEVHDI